MAVVPIIALLALGACTPGYQPTERDRNAATGGLIGAGAGALVGSVTGSAGRGALIGGALGTLAGALTTPDPGYAQQQPYAQPYQQPYAPQYQQPYQQPYAPQYQQPYQQSYQQPYQQQGGWYDQYGQWQPGLPPQGYVPVYR
jgi:phage tail tape-measure protein